MEIRKPVERSEIVDITCDVCNTSCRNDYINLYHSFGYNSINDGLTVECELCEACFYKVMNFIEDTLKGKIRKENKF